MFSSRPHPCDAENEVAQVGQPLTILGASLTSDKACCSNGSTWSRSTHSNGRILSARRLRITRSLPISPLSCTQSLSQLKASFLFLSYHIHDSFEPPLSPLSSSSLPLLATFAHLKFTVFGVAQARRFTERCNTITQPFCPRCASLTSNVAVERYGRIPCLLTASAVFGGLHCPSTELLSLSLSLWVHFFFSFLRAFLFFAFLHRDLSGHVDSGSANGVCICI